jgi:hypothetical protein
LIFSFALVDSPVRIKATLKSGIDCIQRIDTKRGKKKINKEELASRHGPPFFLFFVPYYLSSSSVWLLFPDGQSLPIGRPREARRFFLPFKRLRLQLLHNSKSWSYIPRPFFSLWQGGS